MSGKRREQRTCKVAYSVSRTETVWTALSTLQELGLLAAGAVLEAHGSGFRCVLMDAHVHASDVRSPSRLGYRS